MTFKIFCFSLIPSIILLFRLDLIFLQKIDLHTSGFIRLPKHDTTLGTPDIYKWAIQEQKIVYAVRVGPPLDTQTPIRDTNTYTSVCSQTNN